MNDTLFLFSRYTILLTLLTLVNIKILAQPIPKINSVIGLVPSCITEEQALTLTINGSNFATQASQETKVRIRGTAFSEQFIVMHQLQNTTTQIQIQLSANSVVLLDPGILIVDIQQKDTTGKDILSNAVQLPVYPKTGAISGATSVCHNIQNYYTVPILAGATSYEWTVILGNATIVSGGTTNTTRIDFTNASSTVKVGVKTINSCGTIGSTSTLDIQVNTTPEVNLAAFRDICVNAPALTLANGTPAGGTYTVDGVIATSFDPDSAGVGDHVITYYVSQDGCTASASQSIKVKPSPVVSFPVTLQPVCINAGPIALSGGLPAGTTFNGPGVIDDDIYQAVRWSEQNTNFSYKIPVSNSQYTVILHFTDINWTEPGRSFDVDIEDIKVLDNYDIVDKVGANTATTENFLVSVEDDTLTIDFIGLTSEGGISEPIHKVNLTEKR